MKKFISVMITVSMLGAAMGCGNGAGEAVTDSAGSVQNLSKSDESGAQTDSSNLANEDSEVKIASSDIVVPESDSMQGTSESSAFENSSSQSDSDLLSEGDNYEDWQCAYANCIIDIMKSNQPFSDGIASTYYKDLSDDAYFAIYDITGDDMPELIVTMDDPTSDYFVCEIYQADGEAYVNVLKGFDAYDPDNNRLYSCIDYETIVYEAVDGSISFVERYNHYEDGWFYSDEEDKEDEAISGEEGEAFDEQHMSLRAGFKDCFEFMEMTEANINSAFSISG